MTEHMLSMYQTLDSKPIGGIKEILAHVTTWMQLDDFMLSEINTKEQILVR